MLADVIEKRVLKILRSFAGHLIHPKFQFCRSRGLRGAASVLWLIHVALPKTGSHNPRPGSTPRSRGSDAIMAASEEFQADTEYLLDLLVFVGSGKNDQPIMGGDHGIAGGRPHLALAEHRPHPYALADVEISQPHADQCPRGWRLPLDHLCAPLF